MINTIMYSGCRAPAGARTRAGADEEENGYFSQFFDVFTYIYIYIYGLYLDFMSKPTCRGADQSWWRKRENHHSLWRSFDCRLTIVPMPSSERAPQLMRSALPYIMLISCACTSNNSDTSTYLNRPVFFYAAHLTLSQCQNICASHSK